MNNIYVPDTSYACYVVQSEGVIRAYEEIPQNNNNIDYRDFYIKSNYIFKDGNQSFGSYSTLPTCLDNSVLTDNYYYRNDFADILIIFTIMCIFGLYIPINIFLRMFKRLK